VIIHTPRRASKEHVEEKQQLEYLESATVNDPDVSF